MKMNNYMKNRALHVEIKQICTQLLRLSPYNKIIKNYVRKLLFTIIVIYVSVNFCK